MSALRTVDRPDRLDSQTADGREGSLGPPLPLPGSGPVVPWPVGVFGPAEDYVTALTDAFAVPRDLVAIGVLGTVSALVGGGVVVEASADWRQPVNLYLLGLADVGDGKSPLLGELLRPLDLIEQRQREDAISVIAAAESDRRVAEERLRALQKLAAKPSSGSMEAREAAQAAIDLAELQVPPKPRIYIREATPEALEMLVGEQRGRLAVISDEGGEFFELASRYQQKRANIGIYLAGADGQSYRSTRVGRGGVDIPRVTLTVCALAQPVVAETLGTDEYLEGRGLLARILWSWPKTLVGTRPVHRPAIPEDLREWWCDRLDTLAKLTKAGFCQVLSGSSQRLETTPLALGLSGEARESFFSWAASHEPRLHPDTGDLAHLRGWASKLPGQVLRLSGVLHAIRTGAIDGPITGDSMTSALCLASYFTAHAEVTFGHMRLDPATRDAHSVRRWMDLHQNDTFTTRELCRSRSWPVDRVQAAIGVLNDHRHVLPLTTRSENGGRPSERWQIVRVNADAPELPDKTRQNLPADGSSRRSWSPHPHSETAPSELHPRSQLRDLPLTEVEWCRVCRGVATSLDGGGPICHRCSQVDGAQVLDSSGWTEHLEVASNGIGPTSTTEPYDGLGPESSF